MNIYLEDRKEQIIKCKNFYKGNVFQYYTKRFVDETIIGNTTKVIKERNFFPDTTFIEIVKERIELTPTEFSIVGKQSDFIKNNLWKTSNISSKLPELYKEMELSGDGFWEIVLRPSKKKDLIFEIDFNKMNSEEVIILQDEQTLEVIGFVEEQYRYLDDEYGNSHLRKIRRTITKDSITIDEIVSNNMVMSAITGNKEVSKNISKTDNPLKQYDMFPILWFRGYKSDSTIYSLNPSIDLIESQYQLDFLNTDIENLIHRSAFPIVELRKALQKYKEVYLGAGTFWCSRGEEELKIHEMMLNLDQLDKKMIAKKDNMYKLAGLVPFSMRKETYSASSSKVVKFASKEFIDMIKTRLEFLKIEFDNLIRLFLLVNEVKYTDEEIVIPIETLLIDKEELLKQITAELSLGLQDDELIWKKYYPEITEEDKTRIRAYWEKNYSKADTSQLNMDNKLKSKVVTGNKETANSTPEQRESTINNK